MDLPRSFTIRASSHRIHNPLTSEKLATLGQAVSPAPGKLDCDVVEMVPAGFHPSPASHVRMLS